jgi:hypothetical protein
MTMSLGGGREGGRRDREVREGMSREGKEGMAEKNRGRSEEMRL